MKHLNIDKLLDELRGLLADAAICAHANDTTRLFAVTASAFYARSALHTIGMLSLRAPKSVGCFLGDEHIHVEGHTIDVNAMLEIDRHLALVVRGSRFQQPLLTDHRTKRIQQEVNTIVKAYRLLGQVCCAINQREILGIRVALREYNLFFEKV